jgi:hypothetical protein
MSNCKEQNYSKEKSCRNIGQDRQKSCALKETPESGIEMQKRNLIVVVMAVKKRLFSKDLEIRFSSV